jgi:RND superfamily putative drug exporter
VDALKNQAIRQGILEHYVSTAPATKADHNHITRLDVVFSVSPFSEEAMESLNRVEAAVDEAALPGGPIAGASSGIAGTTVQIDDLKRVTTADQHRMYVLVTLGVYAILVILLRRPGICLYLIATVIIGYLASLGMTELVFRSLHTGPGPWIGLDWKVGFFLFVILVAVGEDYNIFLMSRVIEEEHKHGPIEGTRRAVAHTGGIISSCGVIMAGTFGAMLFGTLTTLRELGFALGLGVMLDTFIVRPILVPAFVVLWHRLRPEAKLDAPTIPHDEPEAATTSAT